MLEALNLKNNAETRYRCQMSIYRTIGPLVTVKFLNFGMPEIFVVIYLKLKQKGQTLGYFFQNDANGIANSEDPGGAV